VDSNVAAGRLFGIPIRGTHSHAFVSSFMVRMAKEAYHCSSFILSAYTSEQLKIVSFSQLTPDNFSFLYLIFEEN
jgi:nicotinic acid phosphoribosyltransferase